MVTSGLRYFKIQPGTLILWKISGQQWIVWRGGVLHWMLSSLVGFGVPCLGLMNMSVGWRVKAPGFAHPMV